MNLLIRLRSLLLLVLGLSLFLGQLASAGEAADRPVYFPLPPFPEGEDGQRKELSLNATISVEAMEANRKLIASQIFRWSEKLEKMEREDASLHGRGAKDGHSLHQFSEDLSRKGEDNRSIFIKEQIATWQRYSDAFRILTICGAQDRSQDVERYDGSLGPTKQFVSEHQGATGQIQWNNNLASLFNRPGADPGNVSDQRWCSGTLISEKYLITAGHCFDIDFNGWKTPRKVQEGKILALLPQELALLMHVNFNYQLDGQTGEIRTPTVFPIVRLLEYRENSLDYAVVELGKSSEGLTPADRFIALNTDSSGSALQGSVLLTVFQHPSGQLKKVAAGTKIRATEEVIMYADIDTLGGSSGAGVIDQKGDLIGVHTSGGCFDGGGANSGIPLASIRKVSNVIK